MQKGVHQKNIFNIHQNILFVIFRSFDCFHRGGDNPTIIFRLFIKIFTYFNFCQFFSYNIIYHIFGLQYSLEPWARKLVVLTNIIDQKYPLQHSRNLYYHLQQTIYHIQLIRPQPLCHINFNRATVLQFKTCLSSKRQMISTPV